MGTHPAFAIANLPMRERRNNGLKVICAVVLGTIFMTYCAGAATLSELLTQKDLTPTALARVISDFSFELAPQVQDRKRIPSEESAGIARILRIWHP